MYKKLTPDFRREFLVVILNSSSDMNGLLAQLFNHGAVLER